MTYERDEYMRRQDAEHDMIQMREPRRALFFGTASNGQFLKDDVGDQRYFPISTLEDAAVAALAIHDPGTVLNMIDEVRASILAETGISDVVDQGEQ